MSPTDRIAELEAKLGQAYQVIGVLLAGPDGNDPAFDSKAGHAILSYFCREGYDADVLPFVHPANLSRAKINGV